MKILLADNDYLHKLAACDLLSETVQIFQLSLTDVHVLPTARYKFRRLYRKSPDNPVYRRLVDFLDSVTELDNDPTDEILRLTKLKDIDAGEALLLAVTAEFNDFILATGDKRFLHSVSMASGIDDIQDRIKGRVICLEQTILRLIDKFGHQAITKKVLPACYCDKMLQAIFGGQAKQESVRTGLVSYIDNLQNNTGLLMTGKP